MPQFGYQLHLASPEVEANVQSEEAIRGFINGIFGGRTEKGDVAFDPVKGVIFEHLPNIKKPWILTDKVSVKLLHLSRILICAAACALQGIKGLIIAAEVCTLPNNMRHFAT